MIDEGVLSGLHVVDFSAVGTGPATARYLADFGATVVKVESAARPDFARFAPPMKDSIPGVNRAGWLNEFNRNKYGMTLNLKHPRAREVTQRLVRWADVVVDNFLPGTLDRLGLGYQALVEIRPDIVMMSTTLQGQNGPEANERGTGVMLVGLAGFTHLTGWPDRGPVEVYGAYTDWILPPVAGSAIVAALISRRKTGQGQYIDVSQLEVGVNFLAPALLDCQVNGFVWGRMGNRCFEAAPHNAYPCRGEDRWCAIAVFDDEQWRRLCHIMGDPEWASDPKFGTLLGRKRYEDELDELIASWTMERAAEDVMTSLQNASVPAGLLEMGEDLYKDPQLQFRNHWQPVDHPEMGRCLTGNPPFSLSGTRANCLRPGPCLGEHNRFVCTQLLGIRDEDFASLMADAVFA